MRIKPSSVGPISMRIITLAGLALIMGACRTAAAPAVATPEPVSSPTASAVPPAVAPSQTASPPGPPTGLPPTQSSLALGPGWVTLAPLVTDEPPVRSYICPWLELSSDLPHYSYKVVKTYSHDPSAYTQGLAYQDGELFESTGLRGSSSIRRVDLESGKIVEMRSIPRPFFAEGITLFSGRIYQLTWQENTAFVYNPVTFETVTSFNYETEGWGLTHDGIALIMSDGTDRLTIRDPQNFELLSTISVSSLSGAVSRLNELEYVEGEVWANIYQTSCIARIDPQNGRVKGWIDISGLLSAEEMRTAEVPNGIAFDPQTQRLLVTGKFWPKMFEIEIIPSPVP